MSIQESIRIRSEGEIAVIEFDLIGEKVNKLSSQVLARFSEVVDELGQSSYRAAVLVSKKPKIFIAGADIEEIRGIKEKNQCLELLKKAHDIFNRFEDLRIPTLAAISGACLGGGCELVLCCDYRMASDAKETKIGLPETKLGIFPGFGGCVRLPRAIGLESSLDIILNGKAVDGKKAEKLGLVDICVPEAELEARALAFAKLMVTGEKPKRIKRFKPKGARNVVLESALGRPLVFSQAKKNVMKFTKGFYPAPLKAIEVIRRTYGMGHRAKALEIEMNAFAEVAVTEISKNLIELFFMMEEVKKLTGVEGRDVQPVQVKNIAVLGAGTMGGGIAQLGADKGYHVRMKDISNEALAIGFKAAADIWSKEIKRKKLTAYEFEQKMALVSGGLDFSGFGNVDVVVEAIVEDMSIKKKVIAETASHCPERTIIATNTSSLSISEMAEGHPRPANFVGMHFFNPVNKMPLVEVIRGAKTSDEAVATIFALAKRMGKTPVVVKDGPGFLVNRLLMPWMIEAMFILQDGMEIGKVDHWYTHKFGMPMGPFRLMDEVGLDVCIKVVKIFHKSLGDRIEIPNVAEKIVASGRLGKKNNRGFYLYDEKGKELGPDSAIYGELGLAAPTNSLSEKEVLERGMFQMINEAALALFEDRIVERPKEVDLAMIMGTGFPPFRGGLLRYADTLGAQYICEALESYAQSRGQRLKPTAPMAQMAKTNRKFYS